MCVAFKGLIAGNTSCIGTKLCTPGPHDQSLAAFCYGSHWSTRTHMAYTSTCWHYVTLGYVYTMSHEFTHTHKLHSLSDISYTVNSVKEICFVFKFRYFFQKCWNSWQHDVFVIHATTLNSFICCSVSIALLTSYSMCFPSLLIYLLTAIGLSPGGSKHLHTNITWNKTNNNHSFI